MAVKYFAPEVAEGEFLGDYQVLGILGRGLTGTSYHVHSNLLRKEFVLKTLQLSPEIERDWVERWEAQSALISRLAHPGIDRVLQSGQVGDLWFLVKDFVEDGRGESCNLRTYFQRHGSHLSAYQFYHLCYQTVEALRYAASYQDRHHKGVFHGALKPENMLIAYGSFTPPAPQLASFEVKVSDFQPYGLVDSELIVHEYASWLASLSRFNKRVSAQAETQALQSLYQGYDYRPPEWQPGQVPGIEEDVYALGVILYELMTGRIPTGRYSPVSHLREDLDPIWDRILDTCLAFYPDLRYSNYEALLSDLQELAPDPKVQLESPTVKATAPRRDGLTPRGMVYVPSGTFFVGSAHCGRDAAPIHESSTPGFYCDRMLVTNAQFANFVANTGYVTEAERGEGAPVWVAGEWRILEGVNWRQPSGQALPEDFPQHPVTQVSFADALAYCEWLGHRLPSEEEWEYAARGGLSDVRYPHGNTLSRYQANYNSDGTTPVGTYPANGYGLYDMTGNVWEWTDSWYQPYPGNRETNPHFGEKYRVVRGGSWLYDGSHCQISYRNANQPDRCYPTLGFRTVCDFKMPERPAVDGGNESLEPHRPE